MLKKIVIGLSVLIVGCGHAWVISQTQSSGSIGYKNFQNKESALKAIENLIHCHSYSFVEDRLVTVAPSIMYMPVNKTHYTSGSITNSYGDRAYYNGSTTTTEYNPVVVNKSYREISYECIYKKEEIYIQEPSREVVKVSCEGECKDMFSKKMLKKGESISTCIKKLCK